MFLWLFGFFISSLFCLGVFFFFWSLGWVILGLEVFIRLRGFDNYILELVVGFCGKNVGGV